MIQYDRRHISFLVNIFITHIGRNHSCLNTEFQGGYKTEGEHIAHVPQACTEQANPDFERIENKINYSYGKRNERNEPGKATGTFA